MKITIISIFVIVSSFAPGNEINFFESPIQYWHKETQDEQSTKIKEESPQSKGFSWEKYLNPQNEEFFREGDYIPPSGFMELARNPSDQNIRNWFAYVDKKNELAEKLQMRMREYMKKNPPKYSKSVEYIKDWLPKKVEMTDDIKRFRFQMFFHSTCPHCKRMLSTMKSLQQSGYFIEIKQIDYESRSTPHIELPILPASKEELDRKNIKSWPVLFIADTVKQKNFRLNGYQSIEEVASALEKIKN